MQKAFIHADGIILLYAIFCAQAIAPSITAETPVTNPCEVKGIKFLEADLSIFDGQKRLVAPGLPVFAR